MDKNSLDRTFVAIHDHVSGADPLAVERLFDVRLVEKNIREGVVDEAAYLRYLHNLPDAAGKSVRVDVDLPWVDRMDLLAAEVDDVPSNRTVVGGIFLS